jgi:hypothetical protein
MRRAGHAADQKARRATSSSIDMPGFTPELLIVAEFCVFAAHHVVCAQVRIAGRTR